MYYSILFVQALHASSLALSTSLKPISIAPSRNYSAPHLPILRHPSSLLGQWPPAPIVIDISDDLHAVIEEYGAHSSDRGVIAEAFDSFDLIESQIQDGPTPTQDNPIYIRCGNLVFFLDVASEPWPTINKDVAGLVQMLSLLTTRYRTVTAIEYAQIRTGAHHQPQPHHSAVAMFMLGIIL